MRSSWPSLSTTKRFALRAFRDAAFERDRLREIVIP